MTAWSSLLAPIRHTRQHHALEHATIHVLNRRYPARRVFGWSTPFCFYVYGDLPTEAVQGAVSEALLRLRRGETDLAVHPYCGTNVVTAGVLAGLTGFLTMLPGDARDRRTRLPLLVLLSTLAVLASRPLGMAVQQRVTTDAHALHHVVPRLASGRLGATPVHRVELTHVGG